MTMGPSKKKQETYNIDDVIGKKGHDSEMSSSEESWSNLVYSNVEQPQPLTPDQVKMIFKPIVLVAQKSNASQGMIDRVTGWVSELMHEALKGPDIDPAVIDKNIGNLYFFCDDVFMEAFTVFTNPENGLEPAFMQAAQRYQSK